MNNKLGGIDRSKDKGMKPTDAKSKIKNWRKSGGKVGISAKKRRGKENEQEKR